MKNSFLVEINRFSRHETLGTGPNGTVYKGRDRKFSTKIAIKELYYDESRPDIYDDVRIQIEANYCIQHPTLVEFYGFSPLNLKIRQPFGIYTAIYENKSAARLLKELASGKEIDQWNTKLMKIIYGVAYGLYILHSHDPQIIARNLKPSNILYNDDFEPLICDYALSRFFYTKEHDEITEVIKYIAPEMLKSISHNSTACDSYSYAIILYQLFTRRLDFEELPPTREGCGKVIQGQRPKMLPSIPPLYQDLINKCWDPRSGKRLSFKEILQCLDKPEYLLPGVDVNLFQPYRNMLHSTPPLDQSKILSSKSPHPAPKPPGEKLKFGGGEVIHTKGLYPAQLAANIPHRRNSLQVKSFQTNAASYNNESFTRQQSPLPIPGQRILPSPQHPPPMPICGGQPPQMNYNSANNVSSMPKNWHPSTFPPLQLENTSKEPSRLPSLTRNNNEHSAREQPLKQPTPLNNKAISIMSNKRDQAFEEAVKCETGNGQNLNVVRSGILFKQAADLGHIQAALAYARKLIFGVGVRKDFKEAQKYINIALEKAVPEAQYYAYLILSQTQNEDDQKLAIGFLRSSLAQNFSFAHYEVIKLVVKGTSDFTFQTAYQSARYLLQIRFRPFDECYFMLFSKLIHDKHDVGSRLVTSLKSSSDVESDAQYYYAVLVHKGVINGSMEYDVIGNLIRSILAGYKPAFDYFVENNLQIIESNQMYEDNKGIQMIFASDLFNRGENDQALEKLEELSSAITLSPGSRTIDQIVALMDQDAIKRKIGMRLLKFYADNGSGPARESIGEIMITGRFAPKQLNSGLYYLKLAFDDYNYKMKKIQLLIENCPGFYEPTQPF